MESLKGRSRPIEKQLERYKLLVLFNALTAQALRDFDETRQYGSHLRYSLPSYKLYDR